MKRKGRRPAPQPAKVLEWNRRLGMVFGDRIARRTSHSALSEKLNFARGQVNKVKMHRRGGRPGQLMHCLLELGDEQPLDLYHEAFETVPPDFPAILACSREYQQGMAPSPFLEAIRPRLLALAALGVSEVGRWPRQLAAIRRFERLRSSDRQLGEAKLEWFVRLVVGLLERRGACPAGAFADLACALAALAATYRIGGRRDDGHDALQLAYPLSELANDPLTEGIWHQKIAYLLVDLDRCDRAYEAVKAAGTCFIAAGAMAEQAQTLVDEAFVLTHAKQSQAALKVLRRALRILPVADAEYHFALHQLMFMQLQRLGRYEEAEAELSRAFELAGNFKLGMAALHWGRAALAVQMKEPARALNEFERALELYRRFGSAADVAEVTFEYAELLLQLGLKAELKKLVAGTSKWTLEIKGHRKIRQVLESFTALAHLKRLDAASLAEVRKELPPKKKPAPSYRRKPVQPPGGYAIPVSGSSPAAAAPPGGNCGPVSATSPAASPEVAPETGAPPGGYAMPISAKREIN